MGVLELLSLLPTLLLLLCRLLLPKDLRYVTAAAESLPA